MELRSATSLEQHTLGDLEQLRQLTVSQLALHQTQHPAMGFSGRLQRYLDNGGIHPEQSAKIQAIRDERDNRLLGRNQARHDVLGMPRVTTAANTTAAITTPLEELESPWQHVLPGLQGGKHGAQFGEKAVFPPCEKCEESFPRDREIKGKAQSAKKLRKQPRSSSSLVDYGVI